LPLYRGSNSLSKNRAVNLAALFYVASKSPSREPGHWHNRTMIYSAGELGVEIDLGPDEPGSTLQRLEADGWQDYRVDREQVVSPVDVETLRPRYYRLIESPDPASQVCF